MNVVQYTAKLDLTDNGCFDTGWRIKQGDYGNSIIVISIVNNGEPVFDSAVEPTIAFKRADGRTVVSKMIAGVNNYIYTFAGNELEISGPVVMDVKFEDSDARISTASCKFTCVEDTIGYDPTGADTYNNPVSEIAKEAFEQLVSSEAWAIGKRNGIDVGPEDKTYHNNAKYWSEKSGSSRLISMYDVDINSPQDKQVLVYNALTEKWVNGQGSGGGGTAETTTYDNSKSGLIATNVQDAIDEQKQDLTQLDNKIHEDYIINGTQHSAMITSDGNLVVYKNGAPSWSSDNQNLINLSLNQLVPQSIVVDNYSMGGNYVGGAGWLVFFPYSESRLYPNITLTHFDVYGLGQDIINASSMRIVGNTGTGMLLQPNNLNDGGIGANRMCHATFTFSK